MGLMNSKTKYKYLIEEEHINKEDFKHELDSAYQQYKSSPKLIKNRSKCQETYNKLVIEHRFNILKQHDKIRHKVNMFCHNITPQPNDIINFIKNTGCSDYRVCVIICHDYRIYVLSDLMKQKTKLKYICNIPSYNIITGFYVSKLISDKMYEIAQTILPDVELIHKTNCSPDNLLDGYGELANIKYVLKK